jgi:2-oxoisovalerate dehydrogenase E2 component (dihydrolipoyl transacylase)
VSVFRLPDLGEGLDEAEIVAWHVSAGDRVVADQPVVSVETDKAVVEIPAPRSGTVKAVFGTPGTVLKVGAPLLELEEEGAGDAGAVVGRIETAPAPAQTAADQPAPPGAPAPTGVKASPAVRARARELGVDLAGIAGSGPRGSVTRADIEAAATAAAPARDGFAPLRGPRRAMARRMAEARDAVCPATVTDEADIGAWPAATDTSVRLIRAVAAGCRAEPSLNAWYDGSAQTRRLHDHVDLGLAVDTEAGLIVPVLRGAAELDEIGIRGALDRLKREVEARTVRPEALTDASITLSNFGTIGGRFAALVVVPPQVAILGAGRAAERVVAVDGTPAIRRMMPLSLTFDHRAVTGGEAARFLAAVVADLETES